MSTLDVIKGDSFSATLPILNSSGAAFDLTGCTVWFTVKKESDVAATDDSAVIKLYWISGGASSGITVATPSNGIIAVKMTAAQAEAFDAEVGYHWDVQVKDTNGDIWTAGDGLLVVTGDVTRRTSTP